MLDDTINHDYLIAITIKIDSRFVEPKAKGCLPTFGIVKVCYWIR